MTRAKYVTAHMVPSLESPFQPSIRDEISFVPALSVELQAGDESVKTVGVVDTTADLSLLDEEIFNSFIISPPPVGVISISTGSSVNQAQMYSFDVNLLGQTKQRELTFNNVPTVVTSLHRPVFLIGRQGLLEWLKVELDFPRRRMKLTLERTISPTYPTISREFSSLDSIMKSFEAGHSAEAIMMLAWEMERFIDRLVREDYNLRVIFEAKPIARLTLGNKLRLISNAKQLSSLWPQIQEFTNARNMAAHARNITDISEQSVLAAAEAIVHGLRV